MNRPGTLPWLARHEVRLAWRDWVSMMTAGRPGRWRIVALVLLLFVALVHLIAWGLTADMRSGIDASVKADLALVAASAVLAMSLMLSQALEMTTRAFYARGDLDLIFSSPTSAPRVFLVRAAAIALSTSVVAMPMAAPLINVLAWRDGAHWLGAYAAMIAAAAATTALALALTLAMLRTIGPKRTRLASQIVAAVVGAAFVIGVQAAAILSVGNLSRFEVLRSDAVLALLPDADSAFWWPALAAMGEPRALAAALAAGLALFGLAVLIVSRRFAEHAVAAAGASAGAGKIQRAARPYRAATAIAALRRKEWTLLRRDPWLVSQTLMQILYLLPPALLLWRNFGANTSALLVLVPVLVMAAGQLAGGLAWLAVSGEDAPDLVATAPVRPRAVMRAKVEAVLGAVAVALAPLLVALAFASLREATVAAIGVALASASSTLIQIWFRKQARRSQFRRRQTSSRLATFAEAFSSIAWACTAALVAAETWLALAPAGVAFAILAGARALRPR